MGTLFFFHSPIPRFSLPSMPKPIALPPLSCLRNNGDVNKIVDMPQSMYDDNQNVKQDNIWQLSKEAQQNNLSTCSELLLRIDTMVLSSMISAGEASELRSLVMNYKVSPPDVFNIISHKKDPELLGELRRFSDGHKNNGFYTVHICTEMTPLVPRGSVASYVTGISRALHRKGHLVELILPKYASLNLDGVQGLHEVNVEVTSYFNGQLHGNRIWTGVVFGIGVTLIEPKYYSSFFSREMIYGYPDDFERFSYFCRASLDYIVKCGKQPDVLHLHNWGTAIVGPLFRDTGKLVIAPYGLDKSTWDPLTDYFLPENFNAENMNGKAVCKAALLQQLGLSEHSSAILVGCIFSEGRDLDEKRVEEVILNAKQHDVQFIFMGASKRSVLNQAPESLQKEFKDDNLKFVPTYDEALLHLVFAGSDIILCQSFLDPTDEIPRTNPAMWKRKIMQAMAHDLSWDGECYDVHVEAYSTIKNM
ncbi:hypothetical protein JHK87_025645 [Glycine soja]|nr:hypothetical protein JHK87_025645 [Glycine soja]